MSDLDPAARIAELLGEDDLSPWQRRWLDEVLDPAHKDEHLEWRFTRKHGYVQVWVPNRPEDSVQ